jgi:hypothetical protein
MRHARSGRLIAADYLVLVAVQQQQLWDLTAGKLLTEFEPHEGAVTAVECAPRHHGHDAEC